MTKSNFESMNVEQKLNDCVVAMATKYGVDLNTVKNFTGHCLEIGEPKTGNTIIIRYRESYAIVDGFQEDKPKANRKIKLDCNVRTIDISARRWFDKVNGNTYFSAVAWVNGEKKVTIDYAYGYGDHYVSEITELLNKEGFTNCHGALWRFCDANGINLITNVSDVTRKRDL